jgi:DNA glycosylase AlkZ-like
MEVPSIPVIERALYVDRSVIRHHAMRRTLWVLPRADAGNVHFAGNPRIVAAERKRLGSVLEQNGVTRDPAGWIDAASDRLERAIGHRGTATTRQLGEDLPDLAVPLAFRGATWTAHARVLLIMGFEARIVRGRPIGSWISSQYEWSLAEDWAPGTFEPVDRVVAAAEVVLAYLRGFGPVTTVDVAWWTGWTLTAVREALSRAGAVPVDLEGFAGWVAPDHEPSPDPEPWVALLPGLDPTSMGWKERDWYVAPEAAELVFDRNGNAGPTIWMDGRIVGGWMQEASGDIVHRLIDPGAQARHREVEEAVARLRTFYGDVRHKVRFPSPIQRDLGRGAPDG